jgi:hypothetical protein
MGGGMTAEKKKEMIKEMQGLMVEIVALDKELSDESPPVTDLKSPGIPDGVWGGNTEASYQSILKGQGIDSSNTPKDMREALLFLNKTKTALGVAKASADKKTSEEAGKNTSPSTKPNSASQITDDQAKAAFKGLLESIQSGRVKLKAGSNTNVFRQRIGRDWGAIIRAYKGPEGVVNAFYPSLRLNDADKAQLVEISKGGVDEKSTVVGKINQQFLKDRKSVV